MGKGRQSARSKSSWANVLRLVLRSVQVGCGTSLPTAFLLRSLLSLPTSSTPSKTILHLQDYNHLVLSLVSLPNLILAALPYLPPEVLRLADEGDEPIETVVPDLEEPGNLSLNKDLVEAFQKLLEERGIELKFTYGHWEGLSKELKEEKDGYGLVLTAETIYSQDSTPALIDVLREAVGKSGPIEHKVDVELESSLEDLRVKDDWAKRPLREVSSGLVLVAAKVSQTHEYALVLGVNICTGPLFWSRWRSSGLLARRRGKWRLPFYCQGVVTRCRAKDSAGRMVIRWS